jgi:hypothetical protein
MPPGVDYVLLQHGQRPGRQRAARRFLQTGLLSAGYRHRLAGACADQRPHRKRHVVTINALAIENSPDAPGGARHGVVRHASPRTRCSP